MLTQQLPTISKDKYQYPDPWKIAWNKCVECQGDYFKGNISFIVHIYSGKYSRGFTTFKIQVLSSKELVSNLFKKLSLFDLVKGVKVSCSLQWKSKAARLWREEKKLVEWEVNLTRLISQVLQTMQTKRLPSWEPFPAGRKEEIQKVRLNLELQNETLNSRFF